MPPISPAPEPTATLVLAADDPAALARFYGALFGVDPRPGLSPQHWCLALPGGGSLELYAPSRDRPLPRGRGRLGLCLRLAGGVPELERRLASVRALGAQLLEPLRQEAFGHEVWLLDPEGNGLLLLVLAP